MKEKQQTNLELFKLKLSLLGVSSPKNIEKLSQNISDIEKLLEDKFEGKSWPENGETMIGYKRLTNIEFCIIDILNNNIDGDFIETGVWRGGACIFMNAILKYNNINNKKVWVADSFQGLPEPNSTLYPEDNGDIFHTFKELNVSIDEVKKNFEKYNVLNDNVFFLEGWFKDSIKIAPIEKLSILRLDGDMYESTIDVLFYLYPKLSIGGYCIIDDWSISSCKKAIIDYRMVFNIEEEIQIIDWTGVFWKKEKETTTISRKIFNEKIKPKVTFNLPYIVKNIDEVSEKNNDIIIKNEENYVKNNVKNMNFSIIIVTTKNQESSILKLLESLTEFKINGGEVCLLDIASTDNTVSIASDWGCKIQINNLTKFIDDENVRLINEKFNADSDLKIVKKDDTYFDFSAIKNYASSLASNDMIIMLNCSEYFIKLDFNIIEKYINEGYDKLDINSNYFIYNRKKHTWNNIVNETLHIIENEEIKKIDISKNIYITHNNITENVLIELAVDCYQYPNNIKNSKAFGIELLNNNFLNSAEREFYRYKNMCDSDFERGEALILIGDCLMKQNRINEALDSYHKSYLEYSNRRLSLFKLGSYFFRKDWNKCIFYLEGCLNITEHNEIDDIFQYKDGPHSMLYVAYWWIGDKKKGKYHFDKALEYNPYNSVYLNETKFHYEYLGTNIIGNLSFKETQYLYNESKKYNSVLEIGCDRGRGSHALLNGCNGFVSIVTKNSQNTEFFNNVEIFGNVKLIKMTSEEAEIGIGNEMFDMIFINGKNPDEIKKDIILWEKHAKHLICGNDYLKNKKIIDEIFEISGIEDDIWFKHISQFQKSIIYTKKEIL